MKCIVLLCLVAGILAELPRFRPARFRSQRIELAPTTTDSPTEPTTEGGPYAPSGWMPDGEPFKLPQETEPADSYGAPQQNGPYPSSGWKPDGPQLVLPQQQQPPTNYGAPETGPVDSYGAPQQSGPYPASGWKPDGPLLVLPQQQQPSTSYGSPDDSYGVPVTDAPTTDNPQVEKLDGPVEVQKSVGSYYILLPSGQLQKIEFATQNDVQNMKYVARLQLRNPAPLFVFGP